MTIVSALCFIKTMDRRTCVNAADNFCYICGHFTPVQLRKPITQNAKKSYFYYFKVHVVDQDKTWAPHIACNSCVNHLNEWLRGERPSGMPFAVQMVWREQKDHTTDCYFVLQQSRGIP